MDLRFQRIIIKLLLITIKGLFRTKHDKRIESFFDSTIDEAIEYLGPDVRQKNGGD